MNITSVAYSPYSNYPSPLSKAQGQKDSGAPANQETPASAGDKRNPAEAPAAKPDLSKQDPSKSAQTQKQIDELKKIDSHVRAHERAHLAAAGGLATGGASFSYRTGPDGKQYAVGGEVSIDVSPGRTPQETISKAERVQAAALAPSDPSAQDRSVASRAAQMKLQAQQELSEEKLSAAKEERGGNRATSSQQKTAAPESPPSAAKPHPGIASYRANNGIPGQASGGIVNSAA